MNHRRFFFTGLAALVGVAALLALQAGGQVSSDAEKGPPTIVEAGPDGTLIERTPDGKVLRVTKRSPNELNESTLSPWVTTDGRTFYTPHAGGYGVPSAIPQDPETQKLLAQEQSAAQEARTLAASAQQAGSDGEKADAKKKLREKLAQIFDLQQQRRTREIAKIEERLGKLKDTLKKREGAKDSIVDRRLDTLTGGVDELGWEESFPNQPSPYSPGNAYPSPVPVPGRLPTAEPRYAPPPPVAPRASNVPGAAPPAPARAPVVPLGLPAPPTAAEPPAAPAPVALPAPAARR